MPEFYSSVRSIKGHHYFIITMTIGFKIALNDGARSCCLFFYNCKTAMPAPIEVITIPVHKVPTLENHSFKILMFSFAIITLNQALKYFVHKIKVR